MVEQDRAGSVDTSLQNPTRRPIELVGICSPATEHVIAALQDVYIGSLHARRIHPITRGVRPKLSPIVGPKQDLKPTIRFKLGPLIGSEYTPNPVGHQGAVMLFREIYP